MRSATALTSWARAIRKALDASGLDSRALFAEAGLDYAALEDPNARYPVSATTRLWQLAVQASGDPAFGLNVARHVGQTTFHALGYSLAASETLQEAFARLVRYFGVVTDAAAPRLVLAEDGCYHFLIESPPNTAALADEAVDAFAALVVRLCRGLSHRSFAPLRVELRRPAPLATAAYERVFRAPLVFGAAANRLVFAGEAFEQKLEGANHELARQNDEIAARYLARLDRHNLRARVHAALIEQLPRGEPSEERIAAALHVSARKLQRRLAEEGTSYKTLLNDTRRELALSYLRDPAYTISEITYLLGFADQSSFGRAFRRWTGQTPSRFRESCERPAVRSGVSPVSRTAE